MESLTQEVRAAKEKAKQELLKSADLADSIVGIGLEKLAGGYGIKVNLRKPAPPQAALPASVDGVPVRFEVVGEIRKRNAL